MNRSSPAGEVQVLSLLVGKVLKVFRHTSLGGSEPVNTDPLKDKWARIALQVRALLYILLSI